MGIVAGFRWLISDRDKQITSCNERISRLEAKLDESALIIRRQAESQQKQIDSQSELLEQQQRIIAALQSLGKGSSS